jgi:hypothetical protein
MDVGEKLDALVTAKLTETGITSSAFNKKAAALAHREPDRFYNLEMRSVRNFCQSDTIFHGFVRLTEREYNTLIFILWDCNKAAFEQDTGIVVGAYDQKLREEHPILKETTPHFENPETYWDWQHEKHLEKRRKERYKLWVEGMQELRDDDNL